jgi:hypothetical protein
LEKKEGSVSKFGIPLMTMVAVFIIIMLYITYSADLYKKDKIDITAREYILKMEAEGYLITDDENDLINELQMLGMNNISLAGTTLSKVGYANKVNLIINGQISIPDYTINNLFSIEKTTKIININIDKSSTAKY